MDEGVTLDLGGAVNPSVEKIFGRGGAGAATRATLLRIP